MMWISEYRLNKSQKLTGKPSKVQMNCGGGFPVATHFNETVGPGWSVCSENQYNSSGEASDEQCNESRLLWYYDFPFV